MGNELQNTLSYLNTTFNSLWTEVNKSGDVKIELFFQKSKDVKDVQHDKTGFQKNYVLLKRSEFLIDILACNAYSLQAPAKEKITHLRNKWCELKACYKNAMKDESRVDTYFIQAAAQVRQAISALHQSSLKAAPSIAFSELEYHLKRHDCEPLEDISLFYPLTVVSLIGIEKKLTEGAFGEKLKQAYEGYAPKLSYLTVLIKLIILDACERDSTIDLLDCIPEKSKASDILIKLKQQCATKFAECRIQNKTFYEVLLLSEEIDLGEWERKILEEITEIVNLVKIGDIPRRDFSPELLECMRDRRLHLDSEKLARVIDFLAQQRPKLAIQLAAQSHTPFSSLRKVASIAQTAGNEKIVNKINNLFSGEELHATINDSSTDHSHDPHREITRYLRSWFIAGTPHPTRPSRLFLPSRRPYDNSPIFFHNLTSFFFLVVLVGAYLWKIALQDPQKDKS